MTNSVAKASDRSARGSSKLAKVRALRGGVEAMRLAGEYYLPKEERETQSDYDDRVSRSWLLPALDKTIRNSADHIFSREVRLGDDVPQQIADLAENITNEGRDLNTFSRELLEDGVAAGVSFIFVDAPRKVGDMTLAQQRDTNFRPYLSIVKSEDLLGWKTETVNNMTVLTQVRIMETAVEDDPKDRFGQVEIPQVRVLTLDGGKVECEVWRESSKARVGWEIHEQFTIDIPKITLIPFYTNRTGFFQGEPPLDALADLNIAHWQSASDQRNILHTARVPIMFLKGIDPDSIVVGANSAFFSKDENADAKWIEHSGAAIGAGRDDLKDLEERMQILGLQLMMPKPGGATATGEALDAAKSATPLAMMAASLKDALEGALDCMAMFMGLDAGGSVDVNTDYGVNLLGDADLQFLLNAKAAGLISHQTFINECVRRQVLMDDITPESESEAIAEEAAQSGGDESVLQDTFLTVIRGGR